MKLLADTHENVTISANAIKLDLNGHTLNGSTVKASPALTINNTRVTVQDSSEAQTGTIMREDTAENSGVSSHYVIDVQGKNGFLLFNGGTVKNNSGTANGAKGSYLVRVGNDSDKKSHPVVTIAGGTFTQDNFIAIKVDFGTLYVKGGVINSKNSYAVENWLNANIKDNAVINGNVSSWTYAEGSNSNLNISGGTVNGNVESVTYDGAEGKTAKVSITGGVVNGTLSASKYNSTETNDPAKATIEVTGGMFSTDPSRYLIEGSAATPNGDGTFGVAKAYLAQVGKNSYYTMDEAFKAQTASGEAITLLRDYTTGSTFNSGTVARVVDLNGHTWTCTGTDANSAAFEINNPNASLTVKNGKVVSSQLVGLIPSAMGGTIKYDNSTLTFEGVEASTTATSGIETNGNNTNDTVVLKNSTLNVPNGFGIYFPSSGTLTIDNSTINAKTMGAQVCSGNLNINAGSTITVSGDPVAKAENDGAIQDGAAISIVNRPGYKGLGQIAITGGTFTAKDDNAAIKAYTWDSSTKQESDFDNSANTVAVSGGTFSSKVSADLCAEGCTPVASADGTYGVVSGVAHVAGKGFETLQAAIDAAQDGETVTLLADAAEDVVINKSITLDLGGKTLTNTNSGKATISVQGGTVTVNNGNVVGGTGYYNIEVTKGSNASLTLTDVTATAGNTGSSMIDNWGTLTITSGDYSGGLNVVKSEEGSVLTINGGTFTLGYAPSSGYTAVILVYGDTTINGGEFVQTATPKWGSPQVVMTGIVEGYTAITRVTGGHFTNKKSGDNIFHGYGKATSDNFKVSGGTFNKSIPEGYCADGFIPTKNADGTYGVKEGSYVAKIGSKKYETLADAIRLAAKGKTIQLLTDTTENITIAENKQIKLDLNGHTLNGGTGTAKAAILNKGNVTITDTSAGKTGTIKRDDQGIEGETSYYVIDNNGTMVIDQANVVNNSGIKGSSLIRNGGVDAVSSLTINGGTFEQQNFIAVKNDGNGELTINGGTLTSKQAVVQNWNKAKILGGNLTGGYLWTDSYTEAGTIGETVIGGDAQFTGTIYMDVTSPNPSTLKIEGGSLNVTSWKVTDAAAKANSTIAVSGGTFTAEVPAAYCAEGFICVKNSNGTYSVAQKGEEVKPGEGSNNSGSVATSGVTVDQTEQKKVAESASKAADDVKNITVETGATETKIGDVTVDTTNKADEVNKVAEEAKKKDASVSVKLVVKADQNVTANSQITDTAKNATVVPFELSVDMVTEVKGADNKVVATATVPVKETTEPITVTIKVDPQSIAGKNVMVARVHDGKLELIEPSKMNREKGEITFKTAKFSDYAVVASEMNKSYKLEDYTDANGTRKPINNAEFNVGSDYAFAGWYKDPDFTKPYKTSDVSGDAYPMFVKIDEYIQYVGGSLRMDGPAASESTSLRFGYITSVPDEAKYIDSWWTWNDGLTEQEPVHAANRVLFSGGAALANLVVTTLQAEYYTTTFHVTEHLKYQTVDGTTVEVAETASHQHSAKTVAKAVLDNPGASPEELAYAQKILDTIGKE